MGLFDSKEVREAKKVYKALDLARNTSYALRNWLPKSEKEFLNSKSRDRLIETYRYTLETMKDDEIVQSFNLEELGKCYDFVDKYVYEYKDHSVNVGISFVDHLKTILAFEIQNKKYEKSLSQANSHIEGLRAMVDSIPVSSVQQQFVQETANSFFRDMKQKEFDEKFPEFKQLNHMLVLKEMGITGSKQDEKLRRAETLIVKGQTTLPDFSLEDLLLPYLEEKYSMGILDDKKEKALFLKKTGDDMDYGKRLLLCLTLNGALFRDDRQAIDDYTNSFDYCVKKCNMLLRSAKASDVKPETSTVSKK